jgi:type IV pilus assembly protein PilF
MIFSRSIILLLLLALSGCQSSGTKNNSSADAEKRAKLHYQLGLDAIHKGAIPRAFQELFLSDEIKPRQPETLGAIAYAWRLRGDNKQSKIYYKRALKAGGGAATQNNYGSLLTEMKDYPEAVKQLNRALEDPKYRNQGFAFVNLGDAYVGLEDLEKAVASYRKAQMLSENWSYPQLKEADAYVHFKRLNYAQALYETLLRKEPANQQALSALIALKKGQGEKEMLRPYLQTFISSTSDKLQEAWAKDELASLNR